MFLQSRVLMVVILSILFQLTNAEESKDKFTDIEHEEGVVISGEVKIWYKVEGPVSSKALPIILIHGGPGATARPFERSIGPLFARNRKVVYTDYRGVGRSGRPKEVNDYTFDAIANDMEAIRKHLNIKKWIIFSHSSGSVSSLTYAHNFPQKVAALLLCAPLISPADLEANMMQKVVLAPKNSFKQARDIYKSDASIEIRFNKLLDLIDGKVRHQFQFYDLGYSEEFLSLQSGLKAEIKKELMSAALVKGLINNGFLEFNAFVSADKLNIPILLLQGRFDSEVSLENAMKFSLAAPNGYIEIFNKSGHHPYFEERDLVAEKVNLFLTKGRARSNFQF